MSQPLILIAALASGAAGALLAKQGYGTPCEWSSLSAQALKHRLALLKRPLPGGARRLIAATALAGFLASGGLIAYAAEPSAPQQLPKEVVGVIGSGDQLSLQVKAPDDAAPRTIKVGQEYKDGWKLEALTDATATLAKDGEVQAVGLNPAGTVAQAAPVELRSTVGVADGTMAELLADAQMRIKTPFPGLSLEDSQHRAADDAWIRQFMAARTHTALDNGQSAPPLPYADLIAAMGPEGAIYDSIVLKEQAATSAAITSPYVPVWILQTPTKSVIYDQVHDNLIFIH